MKKVHAYQTDDGQTFFNEADAVRHETKLKCEALVDEFFFTGLRPDDIAEGILDHAHQFSRLLSDVLKAKPVLEEED